MLSILDLILIKSLEYFSDSSECVEHLLAGHTVWNYMQGAIHIYADIFDRTSNYKSHAKSLNHHKPHCSLKRFLTLSPPHDDVIYSKTRFQSTKFTL